MSEIIETEWYDKGGTGVATQTIGVVLTYDEIEESYKAWIGIGFGLKQEIDAKLIHEVGTKIDWSLAKAIFGDRIKGDHIRRNLHLSGDDLKTINYNGRKYTID